MHCRKSLKDDLQKLALSRGDTVMLHASIRAIGEIAGGADEILFALEEVIGPDGTIVMYVGCDPQFDHVGRSSFDDNLERELLDKLPAFNPLNARACREFGLLAEFFRSQPGTLVSHQVSSRMAARGGLAQQLLQDHPLNYSYGAGSPLDKFHNVGGKIVLLGSDHDQVTFLHYVEHVVDFPGKRVVRYRVPLLRDGNRSWVELEEFNTGGEGVHPHWSERQFAEIVDSFILKTGLKTVKVGNADSYAIESQSLFKHAAAIMANKATDRNFTA